MDVPLNFKVQQGRAARNKSTGVCCMADGDDACRSIVEKLKSSDIALLAASVQENQGKTCSLAAAARLNRDHVLIVFGAYFQFGNRAGVVTFAFELFGM
jgi:hypothetical protein